MGIATGVNLAKTLGLSTEPQVVSRGSTASDWVALAEVAKEESSSRGGLHREVNVLGLEDVGVRRPSSLVPDVREAGTNGVCCGGGPFSEAV
jgi:hypothetical protein